MQFKDLIMPVSLALLSTLAIQYIFFSGKNDSKLENVRDRSFTAPATRQVLEPLDLEVSFVQSKPEKEKEITVLNTSNATYCFSNYGGLIEQITYKHKAAGIENWITTVPTESNGIFLIALNGAENTPYYYKLIENKRENNANTIIYKGESASAIVTKQFTVYDDIYKVDLKLTVEPKNSDTQVRSRIFYSGPAILDPAVADEQKAIFLSEKQKLEKKPLADVILLGKESPSLFGLENKYFVNTLISDPQDFAKRGYFKITKGDKSPLKNGIASTVLQSDAIKEKTSWDLSFYLGPKETTAFAKVDSRLDGLFEYGWFWFISKPLLSILNVLYGYFQNYGLAIIVLTILLNLIMVPFTLGNQDAQRKHLEAVKKLKYIEQKYKDDPQMLAHHKAEFARKHGVSGILRILPIFLQIPIFIGLNRVLSGAIELYKAPFFGWIHDLSKPDPYYILPVLIGLGVIWQTQFTTGHEQNARQRLTYILLALILTALTSNFSAGLLLFIGTTSIFRIVQNYVQKMFKI